MTKLQTCLSALLALTTAIIIGCANLPPITGTYTGNDGNTVVIGSSTNGITIIYTEHCRDCGAQIPVAASTPDHPALCDTCAPRHAQAELDRWRARSFDPNPSAWQHPVAGVVSGLDYVDPRAYRGWPGTCPGAALDAWMMDCLLTSYNLHSVPLYNADATDTNIITQACNLLDNIRPGGCLWLTISGHGSRTRDLNGDEADGYDEQICLYNVRMDDDRIWALLNLLSRHRPDIHILMISDTCHSGSNYRTGPLRLTSQQPSSSGSLAARHAQQMQAIPNLLHFAACPADSSAWGSAQGGVWTTALIDAFSPDLTYAQWFARAAALMPPNQRPIMEHTGTDFSNRKLFNF